MKRFKIVHEDNTYTLYVKRVWIQRTLQVSFIATVLTFSLSFMPKNIWWDLATTLFCASVITLFLSMVYALSGELWVREKDFYKEEELHEYIAELRLKDNSKKVYYLE